MYFKKSRILLGLTVSALPFLKIIFKKTGNPENEINPKAIERIDEIKYNNILVLYSNTYCISLAYFFMCYFYSNGTTK
jgi:hypothetical protein